MKNKTPWINYAGKFEVKTCVTLVAYIKDKTGVQTQIHKTERYLVCNFVRDGQLQTHKINLPGHVLYCLSEEDLEPLLKAITGE